MSSIFEDALEAIDKDAYNGELENENCIEFIRGSKVATVTFSQGRFISKVRKLAEKFPDQVEIVHDSGKTLVAHIPTKAIHISISDQREMSDEQREAASERLKKYHQEKKTANGVAE